MKTILILDDKKKIFIVRGFRLNFFWPCLRANKNKYRKIKGSNIGQKRSLHFISPITSKSCRYYMCHRPNRTGPNSHSPMHPSGCIWKMHHSNIKHMFHLPVVTKKIHPSSCELEWSNAKILYDGSLVCIMHDQLSGWYAFWLYDLCLNLFCSSFNITIIHSIILLWSCFLLIYGPHAPRGKSFLYLFVSRMYRAY